MSIVDKILKRNISVNENKLVDTLVNEATALSPEAKTKVDSLIAKRDGLEDKMFDAHEKGDTKLYVKLRNEMTNATIDVHKVRLEDAKKALANAKNKKASVKDDIKYTIDFHQKAIKKNTDWLKEFNDLHKDDGKKNEGYNYSDSDKNKLDSLHKELKNIQKIEQGLSSDSNKKKEVLDKIDKLHLEIGKIVKKYKKDESLTEETGSSWDFKLESPYTLEVDKTPTKGKFNVKLLKNGGVKSVIEISENLLTEEVNIDSIIKELIDTNWSGSNEEQMKAVQLLKGLATSDDPKANDFMKKLDNFTSSMKANESLADKIVNRVNKVNEDIPAKFSIAMSKIDAKPVAKKVELLQYALKTLMDMVDDKPANAQIIKLFSAKLLSAVQKGVDDIIDTDAQDKDFE